MKPSTNKQEEKNISDKILTQYCTYEDYLDEQVTEKDLYYLQVGFVVKLVELGYRGNGDTLSRKEFEKKKRELAEQSKPIFQIQKLLSSAGQDLTNNIFLQELAKREEAVRSGKLTTIIFLRCFNKKSQEISGYIDYGHRLQMEDFVPYFERKKKLRPKPSDLSYYNWETQVVNSNDSLNFQVISDFTSFTNVDKITTESCGIEPTESENKKASKFSVVNNCTIGLQFKNKTDRKTINVDPSCKSVGDNSFRYQIESTDYLQIVIFDHSTRRMT
ncbi:hypothetical protein RFI_15651 [Reticulomyxa filosa]|uniref:Cilia- and flagella-associated protein 299 n=1 Tax=Reticulomyxa filosa TaxID=46433 RepID=X6N696_RETFI|nr:hypothetical protein RFI_15651 [Reticulomyxa filosa]|eukprot:ETO21551.1 hypothetical protein RFI_15651 [Reticulomyxa filosa]